MATLEKRKVGEEDLEMWEGDPASTTFTAVTSTGRTITLNKIKGPWLDVRLFGAKGNGTTDDTAAIQAVIDILTSGGVVFFPAGTYLVSATLNLLSNVHLCGVGAASVIKASDAMAAGGMLPVVEGKLVSDVSVRNLAIDGNDPIPGGGLVANQHSHAIAFRGVTRAAVEECRLYRPRGDCVYIGAEEPTATDSKHVIVANNFLLEPYRSNAAVIGGSDVMIAENICEKTTSPQVAALDVEMNPIVSQLNERISIVNNIVNAPNCHHAIAIRAWPGAAYLDNVNDIVVSGNIIRDCKMGFRVVNSVTNVTVTDNIITAREVAACCWCEQPAHNRLKRITFSNNTIVPIGATEMSYFKDADDLTISGNKWQHSGAGTTSAFYVEDCTNINISQNHVSDYAADANGSFYLQNVDRANVIGNVVTGAYNGIVLKSTGVGDGSNDVLFDGNVVSATNHSIVISELDAHTAIHFGTNRLAGIRDIHGMVTTAQLVTDWRTVPQVLARGYGDKVTAGAAETTLRETVISRHVMGSGRSLRIKAAGAKTGAAGNKTIKLYFGATAFTVFPAANNTNVWTLEAVIQQNIAWAVQRVHWKFTDGAAVTQARTTSAEDNNAGAQTLKITGECADAADTIVMDVWIVELI